MFNNIHFVLSNNMNKMLNLSKRMNDLPLLPWLCLPGLEIFYLENYHHLLLFSGSVHDAVVLTGSCSEEYQRYNEAEKNHSQ